MSFTQDILNVAYTQNNAISHKSSLNACLDLFSMGVSASIEQKEILILKALEEDPITAIKVVLSLRDVRHGMGNKDIARTMHDIVLSFFKNENDDFLIRYYKLLPYLPELGSWKDVYNLYGKKHNLNMEILKLVDSAIGSKNQLASKWFPRQSQFHKDYAEYSHSDIGTIRRQIAHLTQVVETQMCSQQWHEINYSQVPSIANKKYNKAFKRNDSSRYEDFLNHAVRGEVKVNSSVLYPHEIVYKARQHNNTEQKQANALWANLPNYMEENQMNILPIIDTSGSMNSIVYKPYSCLDIAIGLGLYFAEHNTGDFRDIWCNFSDRPTFMKLEGKTITQRVKNLDYDNWNMSTNLQAVFDMILSISIKNPKSCPKIILIVSDMEFNSTLGYGTNFKAIKEKYANAMLELPTIVFWRVDIKNVQQPVTQHESGAILINGYSASIMKLICSMDIKSIQDITPLNMMHKTLERYSFVDNIFSK